MANEVIPVAVGVAALLCYALMKLSRKPARRNGNSGADGGGPGDSSWSWAGGSDHCAPADSGGSCDGGGDGGGGGGGD